MVKTMVSCRLSLKPIQWYKDGGDFLSKFPSCYLLTGSVVQSVGSVGSGPSYPHLHPMNVTTTECGHETGELVRCIKVSSLARKN